MRTSQIDKTPDNYELADEIQTWHTRAIGSLMYYAMLGTRPHRVRSMIVQPIANQSHRAYRAAVKRMVRYVEATIKLCLVQEGYIEP
jgi:hypothetical protein